MGTKTTLLTACYNGEEFIQEYIDCLLAQTVTSLQIVFVNDGSTDKSEEILLSYEKAFREKGFELTYIRQENKGQVKAINRGLKEVRGDYLILYDIDDKLMPDAVLHMSTYLEEHPKCGTVLSNGLYEYPDSGKKSHSFTRNKKLSNRVFEDLLRIELYNWPGAYMIRWSMFERINPGHQIYEAHYGQNLQLLLPMTFHYSTGFLDEPLLCYRIRANSLSHSKNKSRVRELNQEYARTREHIVESLEMPEERRKYYINIIRESNYRKLLKFSARNNLTEDMKQVYGEMRINGWLRLYDRVIYLLGFTGPGRYLFRAIDHVYRRLRGKAF